MKSKVSMKILCLVFICILTHQFVSAKVDDSWIKERNRKIFDRYSRVFEDFMNITEGSSIAGLCNEVNNAEHYIHENSGDSPSKPRVLKGLAELAKLKEKVKEYIELSQYTEAVYRRVNRMSNGTQLIYEKVTLKDIIPSTFYDRETIRYNLLSENGLPHLLRNFILSQVEADTRCSNSQSLYGILFQAYKHALHVLAKERIRMVKSKIIDNLTKEISLSLGELNFLTDDYSRASNHVLIRAKNVLSMTSTLIRRCDPLEHKRGETFIEFEKLVQGYLAHEYNLNADHVGSYTCEDFKSTKHYELDGFKFADLSKCTGGIYDCKSTTVTTICPATLSSRRFDGLISRVEADVGNTTSCKNGRSISVSQWNKWPTLYRVEPCACYCDDINNPQSFRRIGTRPVVSDWENNMVVTGFRFTNDSNILRLEIQQGKLEQRGYINESTVAWVSRSDEPLEEDVITLSWDRRYLTLDNVTAPRDHVIIGARIESLRGGSIGLAILTTSYSYDSGEISKESDDSGASEYSWEDGEWSRTRREKVWQSMQPARWQIGVETPVTPRLGTQNTLSGTQGLAVELQASDWQVDASQTVLPFLDIREVVTKPPTPLSGLGLYYRSSPGYGGVVDLGIQTWKERQFMNNPDNFKMFSDVNFY